MKRALFLVVLIAFGAVLINVPSLNDSGSTSAYAEDVKTTDNAHAHNILLKNADGTWKYTNQLAGESSPYLLQHAHNPVNWYPWGKEAFDKARKEGKPIFLSIGYSTCYWCHVMERLVFENPAIAIVMNEHFVNIKVDREERPDVDDIYMAVTQIYSQMTTGRASGGWPMSVFLTPPGAGGKDDLGLKPILAGTYFPPTAQQGRPGFPDLCAVVSKAWGGQKPEILKQADVIANAVKESLGSKDAAGEVHPAFVELTVKSLMRNYDSINGGYGEAPKFPTPNNLVFLMNAYKAKPNTELWKQISYTLERMARGGMYDQVGGGFHRYSVDARWLVPHFEKMLYDNGQLVQAYLLAQSIKPDEKDKNLYPRVVREILDYTLREMMDETGTFWSAQDAEVDAREGGNYVWVEKEVRAAIKDEKLAALALKMFGVDKGPNFKDPHHPNATSVNVLFLPKRLEELAQAEKMTMDQLLAAREKIRKQMMAVRDKRKQPRTDDKVLTSWNGLMIAGFAQAGRDLNEPRYVKAAAKAADYILNNMRAGDGGLYRTMRKGKAKIPGFLEDYSFLTHGLLGLFRADQQAKWLDAAEALTQYANENFGVVTMTENTDGNTNKKTGEGKRTGGYYDTLAGQADLFVRTRGTYDGATPCGNSVAINNLVSLYELTKKKQYLDDAITDLGSFGVPLRRQGTGMGNMLSAAMRAMAIAPDRFP